MTVSTQILGYLEDDYLEGPYGTTLAQASGGMQVLFLIKKEEPVGMQADRQIIDFIAPQGMQAQFEIEEQNPVGMQAQLQIVDLIKANAMQATAIIEEFVKPVAMQARFDIEAISPVGMQASLQIVDFVKPVGMQVSFDIGDVTPLGMQSELSIVDSITPIGMQALSLVDANTPVGMQADVSLVDKLSPFGLQADFQILDFSSARGMEVRSDKYPTLPCGGYLEDAYLSSAYLTERLCLIPGMQADFLVNQIVPTGMQADLTIEEQNQVGMQSLFEIVDFINATGMQFESVQLDYVGMQAFSTIYNTTNLRILCEFPSRGLSTTNWTATTTAAGDFSVQNLDTDIVEQVWRGATGVITGVRVTTDTGLPQGVFLDTLAVLNHNMTTSAIVNLQGTNDATFSSIPFSTPLQVRAGNILYISPALPMSGYRYWRLDIDDPTNPANYIEIGTIVFGASKIFQGECFVDEVDFELVDFADTVNTEGFTNVANSRALKRKVRLEFRFLNFQKQNFKTMRSLFETYRTVKKCLWIPTPDVNSQEVTSRFALFGKLSQIPSEKHRYLGGDADYVSFTVEIDESK